MSMSEQQGELALGYVKLAYLLWIFLLRLRNALNTSCVIRIAGIAATDWEHAEPGRYAGGGAHGRGVASVESSPAAGLHRMSSELERRPPREVVGTLLPIRPFFSVLTVTPQDNVPVFAQVHGCGGVAPQSTRDTSKTAGPEQEVWQKRHLWIHRPSVGNGKIHSVSVDKTYLQVSGWIVLCGAYGGGGLKGLLSQNEKSFAWGHCLFAEL